MEDANNMVSLFCSEVQFYFFTFTADFDRSHEGNEITGVLKLQDN